MTNKSLNKLEAAFRQWRREKRVVSEPIPNALLVRARRLADIHGMTNVVKITGLSWNLLVDAKLKKVKGRVLPRVPAFSRVEMSVPWAIAASPLAEAETATGLRVRIFSATPETMSLFSQVCLSGR